MLLRDLRALRRFTLPSAAVIGLFLLLETPSVHRTLTPEARAYVLCAFGLLFAAAGAAMLPAMGPGFRRFWPGVRVLTGGALAAAVAVFVLQAPSPVPPWLLLLLAGALAASCWHPPPRG